MTVDNAGGCPENAPQLEAIKARFDGAVGS